jgi:hypothetical protein
LSQFFFLAKGKPQPPMALTFDQLPDDMIEEIFKSRRASMARDALIKNKEWLKYYHIDYKTLQDVFFIDARNEWEKIRYAYMRGEKTEFDHKFHPEIPREEGILFHDTEFRTHVPVYNDSSWFYKDDGSRKRGKPRKNRLMGYDPLWSITNIIAKRLVEDKKTKVVWTLFNVLEKTFPNFDYFTLIEKLAKHSIDLDDWSPFYRNDIRNFQDLYKRYVHHHSSALKAGCMTPIMDNHIEYGDQRNIIGFLYKLIEHRIAMERIDPSQYQDHEPMMKKYTDETMVSNGFWGRWFRNPGNYIFIHEKSYWCLRGPSGEIFGEDIFYREIAVQIDAITNDFVYAHKKEGKKIKFPVEYLLYDPGPV